MLYFINVYSFFIVLEDVCFCHNIIAVTVHTGLFELRSTRPPQNTIHQKPEQQKKSAPLRCREHSTVTVRAQTTLLTDTSLYASALQTYCWMQMCVRQYEDIWLAAHVCSF